MTDRIAIVDSTLHYSAWRNINSSVLRSTEIGQVVTNDLKQHNLDLCDIKNYRWVIDVKPEGIDSNDLKYLYAFITSQGVTSNNFRVAFSCVEDVKKLPYFAVSIPNRLIHNGNWLLHLQSQNINWLQVPMTNQFVCLMRRPSIGRAHLAKRLLSHFGINNMIMTFGTTGSQTSDDIKDLLKPHTIPIIGDQPAVNHVTAHRISHDLFYRAPINLVVESSSQIDPNVWRSIFVTEKTFKALSWYQFPLWYAVPGLVAEVRRQGYDVFDDIFENHYYDNIQDPWVRMTQVVLLLKRAMLNQDILGLRKKHWQRLCNNANRIEQVYNETQLSHGNTINELLARE